MIYLLLLILGYGLLKVACSVFILPSQFLKINPVNVDALRNEFPEVSLEMSEELSPQHRNIKTVTIKPKKGASLGTIIIFNGQKATFRSEDKLRAYCQIVKGTSYTVVGMDYAGTGLGRISVWSYKAIIEDGFFIAKKIADARGDGAPVILKGNSLGGFVATKVSRLCHEAGVKAYLWNGRSSTSILDVVVGQIRTLLRSGHYESNASIRLSKTLRPFISALLFVADWNMDVAADYMALPDAYKSYHLIRSPKHLRAPKKDDPVIPYCASFEARAEIKRMVRASIQNGDKDNVSDIAFYRERRKCFAETVESAHSLPETIIFSRGEPRFSGHELFCLFATMYVRGREALHQPSNSASLSR